MVNLLLHPIVVGFILPFVLVFTLIFAILERSKLLGDDVKQINAIIGATVSAIFVAMPFSRNIVVNLMPFLAVFAVILLVFMILYGFINATEDGDPLPKQLKIIFGIILAISLIVALLVIAGWWVRVYNFFMYGDLGQQIFQSVLMLIVIIGAVVAVLRGESKKS